MSDPEPSTKPRLQDLVVITGFSGAGKSTAMQVFEDAGYFCVDNLPPEMLRALTDLMVHEGSKIERAAVVSDVRAGEFLDALPSVLDGLDAQAVEHQVLFLEADEETLLTRYKETRRRHPLSPHGSVEQGIVAEAVALAPLRERADLVIDTTGISAPTLRRRITDEMLPREKRSKLAMTFTSYGHKHGAARGADIAFDVRFLSNPYWDPELRGLTGFDRKVTDYMAADGRLQEFYDLLFPLIDFLVPQYIAEGKSHLSVAVGCTGGRHRSVAITEELARRYREREDVEVEVVHRDVGRVAR